MENIGVPDFSIKTTVQLSDTVDFQFFPLFKDGEYIGVLGCEVNAERTAMRFIPINEDVGGGDSYKRIKEKFMNYFNRKAHKSAEVIIGIIELEGIEVMGTTSASPTEMPYQWEGFLNQFSQNYNFSSIGRSWGGGEYTHHTNGVSDREREKRDSILNVLNKEMEEAIITKGIEDVPCLIDIYNELGGSETFSQMLSSFDGEGSIADLRFNTADFIEEFPNEEDFDNWDATAITRKMDNSNLIEIVFNTSDLLDTSISNYPDAFLALVFVHEVIHAEMYRQLLADLGSNSDNFTQADLDDYLIFDNNLLFDLYVNNITNGTDPQHELTAYKYRQQIKEALSKYNTGLTEDQLEALSWLGLEGTFAHSLAMAANPNLQSQLLSALQQILENGNYGCNE